MAAEEVRYPQVTGTSRRHGFEPVAGPDARVLILGTLPGVASLASGEYYAQPRNAFWRIMGAVVGAEPTMPYANRRQRLIDRRIALWDVCAHAVRPGSADAAIDVSSVEPNTIDDFLERHQEVGLVCFNGAGAASLLQHHVLPTLAARAAGIPRATLPSTSPAYASMTVADKTRIWHAALAAHIHCIQIDRDDSKTLIR